MRIKYSKLLMWMLVLSPVADNVNGYLLLNGHSSNISIVFKTAIFLFCAFLACRHMTGRRLLWATGICSVLILQYMYFAFDDPSGIGYNFTVLMKLLLPVMIIAALQSLAAHDPDTVSCMEKAEAFYCWFFPISLLVPAAFASGFSTYSASGTGNKGFYFAGNEISAVMILVVALQIRRFRKYKTKKNLFLLSLGVVSNLLIGTKTSLIMVLILLIVALRAGRATNKRLFNALVIVVAAGIVLWFVFGNISFFRQIAEIWRWTYQFRGEGILDFLLSGRGNYLEKAAGFAYGEHAFAHILAGAGANKMVNGLDALVEMDFIDLFLWFGVVTSVWAVALYAGYIRNVIRRKEAVCTVGLCLFFAASFMAGHILFAPMVTTAFAVFYFQVTDAGKNEAAADQSGGLKHD